MRRIDLLALAVSVTLGATPAASAGARQNALFAQALEAAEASTGLRHRPAVDLLCRRANRCALRLGALAVDFNGPSVTFRSPDGTAARAACAATLARVVEISEEDAGYVLSKGTASVDGVGVVLRDHGGGLTCRIVLSDRPA